MGDMGAATGLGRRHITFWVASSPARCWLHRVQVPIVLYHPSTCTFSEPPQIPR